MFNSSPTTTPGRRSQLGRMLSQISAAVTYNVRCARSLLNILPQSPQRSTKPSPLNPILLFALAPSSTTPPEVLSDITSTLTQLYPEHVGCISAPLPYQFIDPSVRSGPHICSLAYALVNGVSFRSTISGRAQAQVGRRHAGRQKIAEDAGEALQDDIEDSRIRVIGELSEPGSKLDWEDVWNRTADSTTCSSSSSHRDGLDSKTLPSALRNLKYVFPFFTTFPRKFHVHQPISC